LNISYLIGWFSENQKNRSPPIYPVFIKISWFSSGFFNPCSSSGIGCGARGGSLYALEHEEQITCKGTHGNQQQNVDEPFSKKTIITFER
jgi:hypothetical protein